MTLARAVLNGPGQNDDGGDVLVVDEPPQVHRRSFVKGALSHDVVAPRRVFGYAPPEVAVNRNAQNSFLGWESERQQIQLIYSSTFHIIRPW